MKKKILLFLSLVISSITVLYLLFVSLFRSSFILNDWIVVAVDLFAKIIIEIYVLYGK